MLAGILTVFAAGGCEFGSGENAIYECKSKRTVLDDDAQVAPELGFAADEVLDWALGMREADARFPGPPAGTRSNVEPHDSRLRFALERGKGAPEAILGDPLCNQPNELRVPVRLAIATQDGELDESLPAELFAPRADIARLAAPIDLEELSGSLALTLDDPELRFLESGVTMVLTPDASAGELRTALERRTKREVSLYPTTAVLHWPAVDSCGSPRVAHALAEDDPEWLQPLADVREANWTEREPAGEPRAAAVVLEPRGVVCESGYDTPSVPVSVRLKMQGAGEELVLPANMIREDGALQLALDPNARLHDRPEAFVERFGDFGFDLSAFDQVALEWTLELRPSGASGVFALVGYEDNCMPVCDARGCSGCPGATPHRLFELTLER